MDFHLRRGFGPALIGQKAQTLAVDFLDPGIDVRAIERCDTGIVECDHVFRGARCFDRPMTTGQLPSAPDKARGGIAEAHLDCGNLSHRLPRAKEPASSRHG